MNDSGARRDGSPRGRWSAATLLATGLVLYGVYLVRAILLPLLAALLIAYALDPLVRALMRRGVLRRPAIALLFLGFTLVVAAFFAVLVPQAVDLARAMAGEPLLVDANGNGLYDEATDRFEDLNANGRYDEGYVRTAIRFVENQGARSIERIEAAAGRPREDLLRSARESIESSLGKISLALASISRVFIVTMTQFFQSLLNVISLLILLPLYTFFFLLDWERLRSFFLEAMRSRGQDRLMTVLSEIDGMLSAFFRRRLLVCFGKGLLTFLALAAMGVPFSFPIGMTAGALSVVPVLGPVSAFVPGGILLLLNGSGFAGIGLLLAMLLVIEGIEGFVLYPLLVGKSLGLHPIALLVAFLIGEKLFGVLGVLLAVPAAAAIKIALREYALPYFRLGPARNANS